MVNLGTSLVVQWLGLQASTAGAQMPCLVGELRSCMPCCAAFKKREFACRAVQPLKKEFLMHYFQILFLKKVQILCIFCHNIKINVPSSSI